MPIKPNFKSLTVVLILSYVASFAIEAAEKITVAAPEVTVAEAELSFWDLPYLKEAYIDITPERRKDGIMVGKLGADGGSKELVLKLAQELSDNKLGDYDSLLIAHKNKLLFESYYKRGRVNLSHFQASSTKALTALLLGRAIQLGYLTLADLDKPLVGFLNGLQAKNLVEGVEKVTLHQAMTMSSGLRFSDEQLTNFRENPEFFKGLEQVQAFLEYSEPVTYESQTFKYQSPDSIMVMQVLDAVVPGTAKDFVKSEFFDKLAINNYTWTTDRSGLLRGDGGLSLTSRDMLKLGTLLNGDGKWDGEQLLSADYLAKATNAITQPTEDWQPKTFSYGYFWYQTNLAFKGKSYDVKIAWGAGGNRIITISDLDLIIVITGHDREDTIFDQVLKKIIPAFVK